jgi:hypothetical protein
MISCLILKLIERLIGMRANYGGEDAMMMKKEKKEGLLVIWADIDDTFRRTFRMWHNCEHVAERVTLPGFCTGYRYEGIDKAPNYIMFYETTDSGVLQSEPYLQSVNHPTPRTRDAIAHFRNPVRTIYSLLATAGESPPVTAPYIVVARFNLKKETQQEAIQWYSHDYLTNISAIPGVYRARLYGVDPSISEIMSTERQIYTPGIVGQRFLCLFEIVSVDVPVSQAWKECQMGGARSEKIERQMEHVVQELYWLDFAMDAPGYD